MATTKGHAEYLRVMAYKHETDYEWSKYDALSHYDNQWINLADSLYRLQYTHVFNTKRYKRLRKLVEVGKPIGVRLMASQQLVTVLFKQLAAAKVTRKLLEHQDDQDVFGEATW